MLYIKRERDAIRLEPHSNLLFALISFAQQMIDFSFIPTFTPLFHSYEPGSESFALLLAHSFTTVKGRPHDHCESIRPLLTTSTNPLYSDHRHGKTTRLWDHQNVFQDLDHPPSEGFHQTSLLLDKEDLRPRSQR